MAGARNYPRQTVEGVFRDFEGRRAGMIKAFTTDFEEFYEQCDPEEENLCLYGFPSEQWKVDLPEEEVPPELPEPTIGINFARDGMHKMDWLALVAVHGDAWLLAVAFYFASRFRFGKTDRKCLFNMINDLPSLFEVVTCTAEKKSSSSETMQSKYEHEEEKSVQDMEGGDPLSFEEVFRDFKGRRAGLLKAFTTEFEEFYQQCDPEKENVCLYGIPSEQWEVDLPEEEVPPELPHPAIGINFARDGMHKKDWLSLVAVHSDAWLLAVAFNFGARFKFNKTNRERLFDEINNLPTLFEVVESSIQKEVKKKSSSSENGSNESTSNLKDGSESQGKDAEVMQMQSKKEAEDSEESFEDERNMEVHCAGGCGLFCSFVGSICGMWQLTIGNGYGPCPVRNI
ncbi:PREDICTED: PHD finger protein ALFIN-LIKE 4-like [Fragaria vesca subsp. vesca]|uniref:PHD finger protein ALFIN-LIKE 4-like n=1 Tax=Fragaria vesca subsp. vesca TaxID=101020 RepID=UPI0002C2F525|nr:PREDICTED: PHD finger protein ALFIN-LIKE 4-like [Fragaria vesca subsp. vesca]